MTFQIKLSDLPCVQEHFASLVHAYKVAIAEYDRHLLGVEQDAANSDLAPENRRIAFPPPTAHPLVERAAKEGYEIVGPSLTERKQALLDDVRAREADLIAEVMPPAKQRHWIFREQDILAKQAKAWANIPGIVTVTLNDDDDLFLQDIKARRETQSAITRWAAKLEHDIFDLTEETVDGFEIGAFHG